MTAQKHDTTFNKLNRPLENLWSKAVNSLANMVTPILIIGAATILYIASVGTDFSVLWCINVFFGDVVSQNSLAKNILKLIQTISGIGTLVIFAMTLGILLYLYSRDF